MIKNTHNTWRQLFFLLLFAVGTATLAEAQKPNAVRELQPGKTITRVIRGGESHQYKIPLKKGDYCRIAVGEKSSEIVFSIANSEEAYLADSWTLFAKTPPPESSINYVAAKTDTYVLEITRMKGKSPPITYVIKLDPIRQASEPEKKAVAATMMESGLNLLLLAESDPHPSFPRAGVERIREAFLLDEFLEDKVTVGEKIMRDRYLGFGYSRMNQNQPAIKYLERSYGLFQQVEIPDADFRKLWKTILLNDLGQAYFAVGEEETALRYLEQIDFDDLEYWKKYPKVLKTSSGLLYSLYISRGDVENYEKSIKFTQKMIDHAGEYGFDDIGVMGLHMNLGKAFTEAGYYKKAHETYLKDLELNLAIQERLKKSTIPADRFLLGDTKDNESTIRNNIGIVFLRNGNFDKARENIEAALKLALAQKNELNIAKFKSNLGGVFARQKRYALALKYFDETLPQLRKFRDEYVNTFRETGLIGYRMEERVVSAFVTVVPYYYGMVLRETGKLDDAVKTHKKSIESGEQYKFRKFEARARIELGLDYLVLKKNDAAWAEFQKALELSKLAESRDEIIAAYDGLMRASAARGEIALAIFYGKRSVNLLQTTRAELEKIGKDVASEFVKDNEDTYRRLANFLIMEGRLEEAQIVLYLLKLAEFKELASRPESSDQQTIPEIDVESEIGDKIDRRNELSRELVKLENCGTAQDPNCARAADRNDRIAEIKKALETAELTYNETLKKLKDGAKDIDRPGKAPLGNGQSTFSLMPFLAKSKIKTAAIYTLITTDTKSEVPVNLTKSAPNLKDAAAKKGGFGWTILETADSIRAYPIDIAGLKEDIGEFQTDLRTAELDPEDTAKRIYDKIFRQRSLKTSTTLEEDLAVYFKDSEQKVIMWSLDGILRYVPMSALHDGQKYLVEDRIQTVFTPISIPHLESARSANPHILGLGVTKPRLVDSVYFDELKGVGRELRNAVRQPGENTGLIDGVSRLDNAFVSKEALRLIRSGKFSIVHFATHFKYLLDDPVNSFLVTGNGKITLEELEEHGLFLSTDILVMSACETGLTKDGYGKDAEGLPFSAQKEGAKTVIASLWKISDEGTPELMTGFYKRLKENNGTRAAESFRQSQLALLRGEELDTSMTEAEDVSRPGVKKSAARKSASRSDIDPANQVKNRVKYQIVPSRRFAHPHYWAAFVLTGNWQ